MRLSSKVCDDVFGELWVLRLEDRGLGDYNYSVRNERDHSPVSVAARAAASSRGRANIMTGDMCTRKL